MSAADPHYVYRCYDKTGRLLYVGCSNAPVKRLAGHRVGSWWWKDVDHVRNIVFPNRDAALSQERRAIRDEMPKCNVKGRWFKGDPKGRAAWRAQDYIDFHDAIVQSIETTHGVYGRFTKLLMADVRAELADRFGVTLIGGAA